MSRGLVAGKSKRRRISAMRAGSRWRLCTAQPPKRQGMRRDEREALRLRQVVDLAGRSGRARTCDPRFWRPVLYQLSYTPAGNRRVRPVRAVSSIGHAPIASVKRSTPPVQASPSRSNFVSAANNKKQTGETMNAQTAAKHAAAPLTPSLPQAKPEQIGLSSARLQLMSDAFRREVDKGTLPGATVMVARRGQVGWFDTIGRQSPAGSAPMAHDSIFRIFSMTKPIVSVGIMMLVEDGHFILGDPVAKFIPE